MSQFIPLDYYWLIPGLLLAAVFVAFMASIHAYAADEKKIFGQIAMSFALVYASIMMINYFIQWTVVVPSLQAGETTGLSLFTQYNPHGIFIVLESLGYLKMSAAWLSPRQCLVEEGLTVVCAGFSLEAFCCRLLSLSLFRN